MTTLITVSSIETLNNTQPTLWTNKNGSIYTYVASGTNGQTAIVSGSNDSVNWIQVAALTVTTVAASAVVQHTFKYIKIEGSALVTVGIGAA